MRRMDARLASAWWLAAALTHLMPMTVAADDRPTVARDERLAAIIAAVRAEEAKYQDIEYVARITVRDDRRKDPNNPAEVTMQVTRRVVLQGGRASIQDQSFERMFATKVRHQEVSSFDGDRTRTVVAGNCANIHLGRFVHPKLCPAHSLPMAHDDIGFPLSVYLSGTEAIHAHLGDVPDIAGSWILMTSIRIVPRYDGEEEVDGLKCLRIRVEHWASTNRPPHQQELWLAPERNYHCVKVRDPWHETRVGELRELAPGVWFPARITVVEYDIPGLLQGNRVVVSRVETTVDPVDLAPRHDAAFFRDVAIPADLPVFTIKDRVLVGSTLREPIAGDRGTARMAEVAVRVAAQARRYDNIEVKARRIEASLTTNRWNQTSIVNQSRNERSILRNDLAYYVAHGATTSLDGSRSTLLQVHAFDGQWTRFFLSHDPPALGSTAAMLRRGRAKDDPSLLEGIFVHRPHSLMLRDQMIFPPLADLLALPPDDRPELPPIRFRYCGATEVDGHPCITIRGNFTAREGYDNKTSIVLDLATDRNDIPIRLTTFLDAPGVRPLPTSISRCDDLREIAPGLWYPFRVTTMSFQGGVRMRRGQLLINSRDDTTIESVVLAPRVDDAIFGDVVVPAGIGVDVRDERGNRIGVIRQAQAGVPSLTPAGYQKLLSDLKEKAGHGRLEDVLDRNRVLLEKGR
jgi:hypothetical protein